jgi:GTP-binding protein
MYNYLKYYDIPTVIVATKYDKVKEKDKAKFEKILKETLNVQENDKVVLFSSVTKKGREEIYNILSSYLEVEE